MRSTASTRPYLRHQRRYGGWHRHRRCTVGTDTLAGIESVYGTNFADTYVATGFSGASTDTGLPSTYNEFQGFGGNDTITGNGEPG